MRNVVLNLCREKLDRSSLRNLKTDDYEIVERDEIFTDEEIRIIDNFESLLRDENYNIENLVDDYTRIVSTLSNFFSSEENNVIQIHIPKNNLIFISIFLTKEEKL